LGVLRFFAAQQYVAWQLILD